MNILSICSRKTTAILLVLLTGIIVYAHTFQAPFVLDDQNSIVNNSVIRNPENFFANKTGYEFLPNRYVPFLTFAVNYRLGELQVAGYHMINLIIHLSTALLVFALLRLTFRTPYFRREVQLSGPPSPENPGLISHPAVFVPLFAALLFVVHPVQTQAVTYIVQRITSLATMFYLLSVVLYIKGRLSFEQLLAMERSPAAKKRVWSWLLIAGAALAAGLAMKSKEIAFTLPLAITLYELCFFRGGWKRRLLYLLPILLTLPIIPMSFIQVNGPAGDILSGSAEQLRVGTSISREDYLFTQFRVITTYLRLLILPVNQNLDYVYPIYRTFFVPPVFLSFLLLAAIFALGLLLFFISSPTRQYRLRSEFILPLNCLRLAAFGIIWFFLTLSVESSIIPIKDIVMEHRLYLPAFGAATTFAVLFWLAAHRLSGPAGRKLFFFGAVLLVLALGIATYQRNQVWGDAISLWQDVVDKSPNKARPLNNLGKALEDSGRREEAFKAFSRAIAVDQNYYKSYYNLADLYLVTDQPAKALPLLQTAIRLNPDFTEAYVGLGAALMRGGQFRALTVFLEQNFDRIKYNAEARFYLGAGYAFLGKRAAALRELEALSRLDASYAASLAGLLGRKSHTITPGGK